MALADDINKALQDAAQAGAAAAAQSGKDLTADIKNFVVPNLIDVATHVASITLKRKRGIYTDITAKALIGMQENTVEVLVDTAASLAVLEAQTIFNAIVDALNKSVNAAVGFALLA